MNFDWASHPIEAFLYYTSQAKTEDELYILYQQALNHYGLDRSIYVLVNNPLLATEGELFEITHSDKMDGWITHYMENEYFSIDIMSELLLKRHGTFGWENIVKTYDLSINQAGIFQEASAFNLHNGSSTSIHTEDFQKFGTSIIASSHRDIGFNSHIMNIINILTYQFHLCLTSLRNTQTKTVSVPLSTKEIEILKWTSKGFTRAETSRKLHLSSHTIDYHTRNILSKLQAKNITEALVKAIKYNWLSI